MSALVTNPVVRLKLSAPSSRKPRGRGSRKRRARRRLGERILDDFRVPPRGPNDRYVSPATNTRPPPGGRRVYKLPAAPVWKEREHPEIGAKDLLRQHPPIPGPSARPVTTEEIELHLALRSDLNPVVDVAQLLRARNEERDKFWTPVPLNPVRVPEQQTMRQEDSMFGDAPAPPMERRAIKPLRKKKGE